MDYGRRVERMRVRAWDATRRPIDARPRPPRIETAARTIERLDAAKTELERQLVRIENICLHRRY